LIDVLRKPIDPVSWDQLRVFCVVANSGSFTGAGLKLGLSQSAISRQVIRLEAMLQLALFHRQARGLSLTEQGELLFQSLRCVESDISAALLRVDDNAQNAQGPLRITTTVAFGSGWLTSSISRFHTQYPNVAVSIVLADGPELDLSSRPADVAIRFTGQAQPNLVQRRLMTIRYRLFASRRYTDLRGTPGKVEDLDGHDLVVFGDSMPKPFETINWILKVGRRNSSRTPALCVNSVYGIYRAVKSGLGIAALPHYISDESPDLVEILPEIQHPSIDAFFVYPEELRSSRRVAVIHDFLLRQASI
jgi:DNA-binding transcriptional LysR family regulator